MVPVVEEIYYYYYFNQKPRLDLKRLGGEHQGVRSLIINWKQKVCLCYPKYSVIYNLVYGTSHIYGEMPPPKL